MFRTARFAAVASIIVVMLAACGSSDADRRVIQIVQTNDSCTPEAIKLTVGEKVKFEVKNEGTRDREVEGIDGTKLEELLIPGGRTRTINYTAPNSVGVQKVKCYTPGGASTIIELDVS